MSKVKKKKKRNPKLHLPTRFRNCVVIHWDLENMTSFNLKHSCDIFQHVTTEIAAKKIIAKRRADRMKEALWYDSHGISISLLINKNDTRGKTETKGRKKRIKKEKVGTEIEQPTPEPTSTKEKS